MGVLIEINCETDFVANTAEMHKFAHDVCLHIAANKAMYLNPEHVDANFLQREMDFLKNKWQDSGKPEKVVEQIVEGKVKKLYSEYLSLATTIC